MGVKLREILEAQEIQKLKFLSGKAIAIDAFNTIYQFLSIIRQMDGTPLMNARGQVTSHLSGLFYRTARLYEAGIRPCYIFDGRPPDFKAVADERASRKEAARKKLEAARKEGDWEAVRRYSQQTAKIEPYMVEDAKELLDAMGVPWVQAPSEGEAQAAYMAAQGMVWAAASQDFDSLLFGAPQLLRNVNITGRRKVPRRNEYMVIKPEVYDLEANLKRLGLDRRALVVLGMLVGTDYNPGGVKGIGPKKALALVQEKGADRALDEMEWDEAWGDKQKIVDYFMNPHVSRDVELEWKAPDMEKLKACLIAKHGFSMDRMAKTLDILEKSMGSGRQGSLDQWF